MFSTDSLLEGGMNYVVVDQGLKIIICKIRPFFKYRLCLIYMKIMGRQKVKENLFETLKYTT